MVRRPAICYESFNLNWLSQSLRTHSISRFLFSMSGMTTAAAFLICTSQMRHLLGVPVPRCLTAAIPMDNP